jgi:hypothetical protein
MAGSDSNVTLHLSAPAERPSRAIENCSRLPVSTPGRCLDTRTASEIDNVLFPLPARDRMQMQIQPFR